jgi:hypothetical protein
MQRTFKIFPSFSFHLCLSHGLSLKLQPIFWLDSQQAMQSSGHSAQLWLSHFVLLISGPVLNSLGAPFTDLQNGAMST